MNEMIEILGNILTETEKSNSEIVILGETSGSFKGIFDEVIETIETGKGNKEIVRIITYEYILMLQTKDNETPKVYVFKKWITPFILDLTKQIAERYNLEWGNFKIEPQVI